MIYALVALILALLCVILCFALSKRIKVQEQRLSKIEHLSADQIISLQADLPEKGDFKCQKKS